MKTVHDLVANAGKNTYKYYFYTTNDVNLLFLVDGLSRTKNLDVLLNQHSVPPATSFIIEVYTDDKGVDNIQAFLNDSEVPLADCKGAASCDTASFVASLATAIPYTDVKAACNTTTPT